MTAKSVQSEAASASSPTPISLQLTSDVIVGTPGARVLWQAASAQGGNNDTSQADAVGRFSAGSLRPAQSVHEGCSPNNRAFSQPPTAIRYADDHERWKDTDHASDAFCRAACHGAGAHPWDGRISALPIPDRFTERGAPPVVTLTALGPPGSIEVSGGTVRLRFVDSAGAVTTEVTDPPPPPGNKPVVTVSLDARGKPHVQVQHGKARVQILDD